MALGNLLAALGRLAGRGGGEAVVLGQELAAAREADVRHAAQAAAGPSPMAGQRYSREAVRLWCWTGSPVDGAIAALAADFATLPAPARRQLRARLTMDDFYELVTFARRSALAALRGGDASPLARAFTALAMIAPARIDWRDLSVAAGLVSGAGQIVGAPVAAWVESAAALAEPDCAKVLREFRQAAPDLAAHCGLRVVETSEGIALFDTGFRPYAPNVDLAGVALACARTLETQGYAVETITLAKDLPPVWLGASEHGLPLARMVEGLSGVVSLSAVPLSDPEPWVSGQHLLVFLAEARSGAEADAIAHAAQMRSREDCRQIGVASGMLCAIVIQRSLLAGTAPLESPEGLERLRAVLEGLMH